tara:strand:+ start:30 stop:476 length:447 start_codon:yes stop_codon:yes gene_type:complete
MRVKPSKLASALGITTDALRKQRIRGTSKYEYEIIEGRVFYNTDTLPPSVREMSEFSTTKKTRTPHEQNKSPRYWNSIGKRNEQRIRDAKKRKEEKESRSMRRDQSYRNQEPKKNYGGWVNAYTSSNYWKSISDYERSKKKKTFEPIY